MAVFFEVANSVNNSLVRNTSWAAPLFVDMPKLVMISRFFYQHDDFSQLQLIFKLQERLDTEEKIIAFLFELCGL